MFMNQTGRRPVPGLLAKLAALKGAVPVNTPMAPGALAMDPQVSPGVLTPGGDPIPHETSGMGSAGAENERAADALASRGMADLSFGNIAKGLAFGGGLLSGTGVLTTGLQGMLHQAFPETIPSPMPEFTGSSMIDADLVAARRAGRLTNTQVTREQAKRNAGRSLSGAAAQGMSGFSDAGASRRGQGGDTRGGASSAGGGSADRGNSRADRKAG